MAAVIPAGGGGADDGLMDADAADSGQAGAGICVQAVRRNGWARVAEALNARDEHLIRCVALEVARGAGALHEGCDQDRKYDAPHVKILHEGLTGD